MQERGNWCFKSIRLLSLPQGFTVTSLGHLSTVVLFFVVCLFLGFCLFVCLFCSNENIILSR